MREQGTGKRSGFTLIEMLVVIGIIAVLVGASIGGYSAMTRSADKQKAQELVSNVATALTALFNDKGHWPAALLGNNATSDAQLDELAAYPLAVGNYLALNYDKGQKKTVGLDRFGVLDPWGLTALKRLGSRASKMMAVGASVKLGDRVLHYAVDPDGSGIVNANVGGTPVSVRAVAVVWCGGKDGIVSPYKAGGKTDDVYSWTPGQTRNAK